MNKLYLVICVKQYNDSVKLVGSRNFSINNDCYDFFLADSYDTANLIREKQVVEKIKELNYNAKIEKVKINTTEIDSIIVNDIKTDYIRYNFGILEFNEKDLTEFIKNIDKRLEENYVRCQFPTNAIDMLCFYIGYKDKDKKEGFLRYTNSFLDEFNKEMPF